MIADWPAWPFWVVAAVWLVRTLMVLRNVWDIPRLSARRPLDYPSQHERVTVIVAARDEVERIEGTVRRLFAQQDVLLDVVVVDDRSTDGTGALLDALAEELPLLTVHHVTELPPGWLGKCHACHVGAEGARGSWLLFTDADIWLAPDVVLRAVQEANWQDAAHVALVPHQQPRGLWASAASLAMQMGLSDMAAATNRGQGHMGIGAFNLLQRGVYEGAGGHAALKLEVVDDIFLGLLVRRSGNRTRVLYAGRDVGVSYAATCGEFARVVEKNGFAVYGYSVPRVVGLTLLYAVLMVGALLGALRGGAVGEACLAALLLPVVPSVLLALRQGVRPWAAPLMPLAAWVMLYAVWRSMVLTLKRGGVRWRETFYPLSELKAARRALEATDANVATARADRPPRPPEA